MMGSDDDDTLTLEDIWKIPSNNTPTGSYRLPNMDVPDLSLMCFDPNEARSSIIYSFEEFLQNPFTFSVPTVMLQIILMTITTRIIYYILRPINQPRIVCDILSGIILSPGVIGRLHLKYRYAVYPEKEVFFNRTLAAFGLMFYLFLIGVKMDPKIVLKSGKKARFIGVLSTVIPFSLVGTITFFFRSSLSSNIARGKFLVFLVASLSLTGFPVLADILTELNLLNSELGRLALSMSMVHGIFGWFFLALFTAMSQSQEGWSKSAWAMGSLVIMVCGIVFGFRRWVLSIARRTPKGGRVSSIHLHLIVVGVIMVGLVSEMLGASFVVGPLIMGLVVPDGPPLGTDLVERIGNVAGEVLMPLLFTVAGSVVSPEVVVHLRAWRVLIVMVVVAWVSKLLATMGPAMYCGFSLRKAFLLGLIMNFQGLLDLITYMNFKNGTAPCSVGLLVHMGLTVTTVSTPANSRHHVGLLFWGGPDDREALSYASRMIRNENVTLNVTRFLPSISPASTQREAQIDSELIEDFRKENSGNLRVLMNEVSVSDMEQTIAAIRNFSHAGYDLVMVGRRLSWNSMLNDELEEWSEFPELGVVGDMIAASDFESEFLILVVQQRA